MPRDAPECRQREARELGDGEDVRGEDRLPRGPRGVRDAVALLDTGGVHEHVESSRQLGDVAGAEVPDERRRARQLRHDGVHRVGRPAADEHVVGAAEVGRDRAADTAGGSGHQGDRTDWRLCVRHAGQPTEGGTSLPSGCRGAARPSPR